MNKKSRFQGYITSDMLKTAMGKDYKCNGGLEINLDLLRIRNRNTLPFVILRILSHDKNPDIEIEALDLRSENNLSPCFYPWSDES